MKIKQTTKQTIRCLAVIGTAGLCLPGFAQDSEKLETGEPVPANEKGTTRQPVVVSVGASHQFNTDIDNGGDFSLTRLRAGVGIPVRFNDQWSITTRLNYELSSYDFGGGVAPWHNVDTYSGAALLQYRLDEHWLLYGGPVGRISAGTDSSWNDAAQGGGLAAVNYIMSDTLSFGGGIFVIGQIEDSALVLPVLTANWKFMENWKLNVGFTDLATSGYGAGVSWDFMPEWQANFGIQFHKSRFRINGSGASNDGVGQEQAAVISAGATWSPTKWLSATAFAGIAAGGNLRLETSSGTKLAEEDYDAAPIVGLKANFKF